MTEQIKPCPFCGSEIYNHNCNQITYYSCRNTACPAANSLFTLAQWQHRALDLTPEIKALLEESVDWLNELLAEKLAAFKGYEHRAGIPALTLHIKLIKVMLGD